MAGMFEQFLKGAADGFIGSDYLRDAQHASKIFTTNGYGNAPKFKYLFHVYFEINDSLITQDAANFFPEKALPGLLVKNITLPKYSMALSEMNQYNRKRYVQTKLTYDPVSVTFHDDNMGAIKQIWHTYYRYYYNDTYTAAQNVDSVGIKNTYHPDISAQQNWGYLGEPSSSAAAGATGQPKPNFFKSIKIYGFNQHNFSLYTLVNPIIERFEHDTYDYYQPNTTMENKMTLRYEAVTYSEGALNGQKPDEKVQGFGTEQYYDKTLSPISIPGSNASIMGPNGLVDAADGILKDISEGNILGALQKGARVGKTFKNSDVLTTALKKEVVAGVTAAGVSAGRSIGQFRFPTSGSGTAGTNNTTSTQAPTITGGG